MRARLVHAMRRHPLLSFGVLAYAFSWWPWLLWAAGRSEQPIAGFGPFLAALVVLAVTQGRGGVTDLLRRMWRWRIGPGWYAAAFLIPIAIAGTAAIINICLGAQIPAGALAEWPGVPLTFLLVLLVPGVGGAWEEPGWRGFALQGPLARQSVPVATALLWATIVLWHLPLFLTGNAGWTDALAMIGGVIIFNWLYRGSGGSVLLVMVVHATNNAVSGSFLSPLFSGSDSTRQGWLLAAIWCLAGLAVVVATSSRALLARKTRVASSARRGIATS